MEHLDIAIVCGLLGFMAGCTVTFVGILALTSEARDDEDRLNNQRFDEPTKPELK